MKLKGKMIAIFSAILFCFPLFSCSGEKTVELQLSAGSTVLVADESEFSQTQLTATAMVNGKEGEVSYSVSDESVLSVSGSVLTAKGRGMAEVIATCEGKEERLSVQVLERLEGIDVLDESQINYYGRVFERDETMVFNNTASGFEVGFIGTSISCEIEKTGTGSLKVYLDGKEYKNVHTTEETNYVLADGLVGGMHTVKVLKMTEQGYFKTALKSISCDGSFLSPLQKPQLKLEFYGDSITSGYGNMVDDDNLLHHEDGTNTYAMLATQMLGAQASVISWSGISACLAAKNFTFTMGDVFDKVYADSDIEWDFQKYQADVVIVSLGTNDANAGGLEGEMQKGYKALIEKIHAKQPNAAILCIYGMMGSDRYIDKEISRAVNELAATGMNIIYSPVLANKKGDADHPDYAGHVTAAEQVKELIEGML